MVSMDDSQIGVYFFSSKGPKNKKQVWAYNELEIPQANLEIPENAERKEFDVSVDLKDPLGKSIVSGVIDRLTIGHQAIALYKPYHYIETSRERIVNVVMYVSEFEG
jgi:hypothetical protein